MSLPPLLAARLAKRGIIPAKEDNIEEPKPIRRPPLSSNYKDIIEVEPITLCPDRTNPYHRCLGYCVRRYGLLPFNSDEIMERKRKYALKRYPLPANWRQIGDPRTNRCYYWNTDNDMVSWLPPNHPRAHICHTDRSRRHEAGVVAQAAPSLNPEALKRTSDLERRQDRRIRRAMNAIVSKTDVDPMDPSSYSDIPLGKWSDGLETGQKAKTGVDDTATGALFQMRPYPNPGQVMRMNKQSNKDE